MLEEGGGVRHIGHIIGFQRGLLPVKERNDSLLPDSLFGWRNMLYERKDFTFASPLPELAQCGCLCEALAAGDLKDLD